MPGVAGTDALGRALYAAICRGDGISARELARGLGVGRDEVNRRLYSDPLVSDLCFRDADFRWHGVVRQAFPHAGLSEYCGWYGTAAEFAATGEAEWLAELRAGCARVGRALSDARGLTHSFLDCRRAMLGLLADLAGFGVECGGWELAFEVRLRRARRVRVYADALVISPTHAFSLEFKMKGEVDPDEVAQAAKYVPYLEVVLGEGVDVVCALVLTRARDLFAHAELPGGGYVSVASADMLFNVFDECLGFLE